MKPTNTLEAWIGMRLAGWLAGLIFGLTGCGHPQPHRRGYSEEELRRQAIIQLNRDAIAAYENDDFDAAMALMTKALKEAESAGLEGDRLRARTYLHLGAVYLVGYGDEATATRNFTLAKKTHPGIRMTPRLATPRLRAVFEQAPPVSQRDPAFKPSRGPEPDLPATMDARLVCKTPGEWYPYEALTLRCAVSPDLNAKSVWLHYRGHTDVPFKAMAMRRSQKGWYVATLPGSAMIVASIQVYFEARDSNDRPIATSDQQGHRSVIEVCEDFPDCDFPDLCEGGTLLNQRLHSGRQR